MARENWYFLDVETYVKNENDLYEPILEADPKNFLMGCVSDIKGNKIFFDSPQEMRVHIELLIAKHAKKGSNSYFYAHNHAYDFLCYAKDEFNTWLKDDRLLMIRPKPLYAILDYKGYLIDTMAFYFGKAKELGEELKCFKLDMPEHLLSPSEVIPYLGQDVEILRVFMERLNNDMKDLGYNPRKVATPSALSINCWKAQLKKDGQFLDIFDNRGQIIRKDENMSFFRKAYKGGRNEAFKKGTFDNVFYYDFNSNYSDVMRNCVFPDLRTETNWKGEIDVNTLLTKEGVVKATIRIDTLWKVGMLPIKYGKKLDDALVFPWRKGTVVTGYWVMSELRYALDNGYTLVEVKEAVYFKENLHFNPFKNYVLKLYDVKKNSVGSRRILSKLLLNGLYGKFGQYKTTDKIAFIQRFELPLYLKDGWKLLGEEDDYFMGKPQNDGYIPSFSHPYLSAMITSGARVKLLRLIRSLPEDDVLYVDTDSVFVRGIGDIKTGLELGDLKMEDQGNITIRGEKMYKFNEDLTMGGVPKKYQNEENFFSEGFSFSKMVGIRLKNPQQWKTAGFSMSTEFNFNDRSKRELYIPQIVFDRGEL